MVHPDTSSAARHPREHTPLQPTYYWDEVQHIQASDIGARSEFWLRYLIVSGAGLSLYIATFDWVFLGWVAAYLSTNIAYSFILKRTCAPVSRGQYWRLIAMNVLSTSIYALMPLYLWLFIPDPALKALALCGLIGQSMFNLARHRSATAVAFWDAMSIAVSTAIVGASQILIADTSGGQLCIGFGTLALVLFYVQAQMVTIRDREALASSRAEILDSQMQSAMGQITAGVAHDCNNKLTVIQGNIELAGLTHDPTERAARLSDARQATRNAANMVAQMQAFVQKSPLKLSRFELTQFGARLNDAVLPFLPETVGFSLQIDDSVHDMRCDADLLKSALVNLVLNARDAMETTGGRIVLRIAPGDLDNWSGKAPTASEPYLRFDVRDEGPGVPVEDFHRVQEPFFTTKSLGTGLGLSMVKGFTEQIGGAVMLRNRQQAGLEISLIVPQSARL